MPVRMNKDNSELENSKGGKNGGLKSYKRRNTLVHEKERADNHQVELQDRVPYYAQPLFQQYKRGASASALGRRKDPGLSEPGEIHIFKRQVLKSMSTKIEDTGLDRKL